MPGDGSVYQQNNLRQLSYETQCDSDSVGGHRSASQLFCRLSTDIELGELIGCGGDHGSVVYSIVRCLVPIVRNVDHQLVLKMYPAQINDNEFEFIKAILDTRSCDSEGVTGRRNVSGTLPYLVLPLAVVMDNGVKRGIVMAKREKTLKEFLIRATKGYGPYGSGVISGCGGLLSDEMDNEPADIRRTPFRWKKDFLPIRRKDVITAIMFQLLLAVAALNEELPHRVDGVLYRGFAHNDIHLENILLEEKEGRVSLCDFELVSSNPRCSDSTESKLQPPMKRLPPVCRRSPHSLFCCTVDSWGLGLVILSLLTGVDPLFDSDVLMDDFGEGPILKSYESCKGGVPVLDWDGNIRSHVEALLIHDDPTGERLAEAQPLLNLCSKCLVNCSRAEPCAPTDLLLDPAFGKFMTKEEVSEDIVTSWIKEVDEYCACL